jgi:ribonuclease P protein component
VPRYGRSIVERNRLKRRLREFLRTQWLPAARREAPSPQIVVRVKPHAYALEADALRDALMHCLDVAG